MSSTSWGPQSAAASVWLSVLGTGDANQGDSNIERDVVASLPRGARTSYASGIDFVPQQSNDPNWSEVGHDPNGKEQTRPYARRLRANRAALSREAIG
jgi:hypothetical protein